MSQICLLFCGTTATNSKFVIMDSGARFGQLHTGFIILYKSLPEYEILVSAVHPLFCSSSNSLWVMSAPPPPPRALQVPPHKWPALQTQPNHCTAGVHWVVLGQCCFTAGAETMVLTRGWVHWVHWVVGSSCAVLVLTRGWVNC